MERLLLLFERYPMDFISSFSSSLPLLFGAIRYRYLTNGLKLLLGFFLMYFVGESYSIWLGLFRKHNLFILNIYPIVGILLLAGVYALVLKGTGLRRIILTVAIGLALVCIRLFTWSSVSTVELFIYRLFIITIVLTHLNKIMSDLRVKNILLHSMFWVSAGLIVYATGTFFISLFSEIIFDPTKVNDLTFDIYWNLNNVLFIVMAALAAVGLWFSKRDRENII